MKTLKKLLEQTEKIELGDKVKLISTKNKNNTLNFGKTGNVVSVSDKYTTVSYVNKNANGKDFTVTYLNKTDRLEKV